MGDLAAWTGRIAFACVAVLILTLAALPLGTNPSAVPSEASPITLVRAVAGRLPGPDLLLLVALAWVVRRPAQAPAPLAAIAFLLRDLLNGGPPGLGAALDLLATERMRGKRFDAGVPGFLSEWGRVALLLVLLALAEQVILSLLLVQAPPLGPALARALGGAVLYPVVVAVLRVLLGLRSPRPEEART
ncbi:rod shape-determining protein MreD [Hasllibacter halocynthiae]|uniref:Rod shape-determining protein MreD n=1 Tax=Hasllibacter halocynthiae TaxID=595589 RepID=A0A2T0X9S6_9RHOB|nr:hypothetical protein [Hasllibacter halocynthiae]PRY95701.1 rod shape-determining protein MreD [Hasllibacter halocynthiae]